MGPGSETFQIGVVTHTGIAERVARDQVVVARDLLIVESINRRQIELFIEDRLRHISGETWHDVALKIGRLGYWGRGPRRKLRPSERGAETACRPLLRACQTTVSLRGP